MVSRIRRTEVIGATSSETTDKSLPKVSLLAQIMGAEWMRQESRRVSGAWDMPHPVWYQQAEMDLTALAGKVPIPKLASCFGSMPRDRSGFIDAVYTMHGAAFLARIGQHVDLQVLRGPNEQASYSVRVEIDGVSVQADFKARRDEFRIEPHRKEPEGRDSGSYASFDPDDRAALGLTQGMPPDGMKHPATRESTAVRQLLESALTELPDTGVNIVVLAQIDGIRAYLERALFKRVSVAEFLSNRVAKKLLGTRWRQVGTPAFRDARFARLGGVLWIRLLHLGGPLRPDYRLYVNPNAAVPMPRALIATLNQEIERRSSDG
jgi:hypothetical protein